MESIHSNNCLDFQLPNLAQRLSYLLSVQNKHVKGRSLYLTVTNNTVEREELATYLPKNSKLTTSYFLLPQRQEYGIGYSVHLDNISLDQTQTINELGEIRINPIPYDFLTGIKFVTHPEKYASSEADLTSDSFQVTHNNPSSYFVTFDASAETNYIVLAQSYNAGWKAYVVEGWLSQTFPMLFGKKLDRHLMINNWANGWEIGGLKKEKSSVRISIIFLPQLLQYVGLGLLLLPFIYALWPRKNKRKEEKSLK